VQQLSLGTGVIVAGMALQLSSHVQGHRDLNASDFWPVFILIGLFSIASIFLTRRLPHDAGKAMAQG